MTQLCYINQDLEGAKTVDELVDELLKYLTTDSVMFRTPYTTDESLDGSPGVKLKNMQDEQWGPIQVSMTSSKLRHYYVIIIKLRNGSKVDLNVIWKLHMDLVFQKFQNKRSNQLEII